jgi:hypothetical protein
VDNQRPMVDTFYQTIYGFFQWTNSIIPRHIRARAVCANFGSDGQIALPGYIVQNFTEFRIGKFYKLRGSELARQVHHSWFSVSMHCGAESVRNLELLN